MSDNFKNAINIGSGDQFVGDKIEKAFFEVESVAGEFKASFRVHKNFYFCFLLFAISWMLVSVSLIIYFNFYYNTAKMIIIASLVAISLQYIFDKFMFDYIHAFENGFKLNNKFYLYQQIVFTPNNLKRHYCKSSFTHKEKTINLIFYEFSALKHFNEIYKYSLDHL